MTRYLRIVPIALGFLALTAACGANLVDPEPLPLGSDPTAPDVVDATRTAMADVTSYRWVSDVWIDSAISYVAPTQIHTEGVWRAPDDYSFVSTYQNENGPFVIEERWIDGRAFRRRSGAWIEWLFRDPTAGIPRYRGSADLPRLDASHFVASPTDPLLYAVTGTATSANPDVGNRAFEFSVRQSDPRLVSLTQEVTLPENRLYRITTQFSEYNQPITIVPPVEFELLDLRPDPNATPLPDATPTRIPTPTPTVTPTAALFIDATEPPPASLSIVGGDRQFGVVGTSSWITARNGDVIQMHTSDAFGTLTSPEPLAVPLNAVLILSLDYPTPPSKRMWFEVLPASEFSGSTLSPAGDLIWNRMRDSERADFGELEPASLHTLTLDLSPGLNIVSVIVAWDQVQSAFYGFLLDAS